MIKRTTFAYVYFLTRVFFIGFGFSYLFNIANKDASISFILGNLLSILIVCWINKIKKKYQDKQFLQEKGHVFLKFLIVIFSSFMAIEILFIFLTLASNFFLVKSPHWFILLPALLLVYRFTKNSWKTIGRVGSILMYISLIMVIIALVVLTGYIEIDNYLPILTTNTINILQATLYYAVYSTAPLVLMILIKDTDNHLPRYYVLANLTIIIMGVLIIGILGPDLINIYRYPEYMVLKVIKILNFIEKVENVFAISTLFDLFMVLSICMNSVKEKLPKKRQKLWFILILLAVFTGSLLLGIYYSFALQLYFYLPIILLVLMMMILILFTFCLKKLTK